MSKWWLLMAIMTLHHIFVQSLFKNADFGTFRKVHFHIWWTIFCATFVACKTTWQGYCSFWSITLSKVLLWWNERKVTVDAFERKKLVKKWKLGKILNFHFFMEIVSTRILLTVCKVWLALYYKENIFFKDFIIYRHSMRNYEIL